MNYEMLTQEQQNLQKILEYINVIQPQMLQQFSSTKEKNPQVGWEMVDLVKTSLQFEEINLDNDEAYEFHPVETLEQENKPVVQEEETITFTSYLSRKPQTQLENQLLPKVKLQEPSTHTQSQEPTLHQFQLPNKIQGHHHFRGPSKIKDILASLKAGILFDLQKIASDLLSDQPPQMNETQLTDRISFSQANLFNHVDEDKVQATSSLIFKGNSRTSQHSSRYRDEDSNIYQDVENSIEILQTDQSVKEIPSKMDCEQQVPTLPTQPYQQEQQEQCIQNKEIPQRRHRKRSKLSKRQIYCLDIIEENSYEQITPEKNRNLTQSEVETIQNNISVPCFGSSFTNEHKPLYLSQYNAIGSNQEDISENQCLISNQFQNKKSGSGIIQLNNFAQSNCSELQDLYNSLALEQDDQISSYKKHYLIQQTTSIIEEDVENFTSSNQTNNNEESAILESWNNLCAKILQQNLLPVQFNIERMQEDTILRARGTIQQGFTKAKRKIQIARRRKESLSFSEYKMQQQKQNYKGITVQV